MKEQSHGCVSNHKKYSLVTLLEPHLAQRPPQPHNLYLFIFCTGGIEPRGTYSPSNILSPFLLLFLFFGTRD